MTFGKGDSLGMVETAGEDQVDDVDALHDGVPPSFSEQKNTASHVATAVPSNGSRVVSAGKVSLGSIPVYLFRSETEVLPKNTDIKKGAAEATPVL